MVSPSLSSGNTVSAKYALLQIILLVCLLAGAKNYKTAKLGLTLEWVRILAMARLVTFPRILCDSWKIQVECLFEVTLRDLYR
jgi:hypothetical protein